MHVLVGGGGIVVCVLLQDYVNVSMCNLHNPHRTGHIENRKQHTADLQLVALFLFLFNIVAHKQRLDGGVYF